MNYTDKYNLNTVGDTIISNKGSYDLGVYEVIMGKDVKRLPKGLQRVEYEGVVAYCEKKKPEKIAGLFAIIPEGKEYEEQEFCKIVCELCKQLDISISFTNCDNRVVELAKDLGESPERNALRIWDAVRFDCEAQVFIFSTAAGMIRIKDVNGEVSRGYDEYMVVINGRRVYDPMHGYVGIDLLEYAEMLESVNEDVQYRPIKLV